MFNTNTLLMLGAAVLAGAVVPFQAGANAALGRALGHPLWASLVSLGIGAALVIAVMLALRVPEPALGAAWRGPCWLWAGGAAGALYVVTALVLAPRLGAAHFIVAVVAGQMAVSLLIDHAGLMGFAHQPVGAGRVIGLLLIVAGMLVTQMASAGAPAAR
ncbi:DMT family transporter [Massilia atriviolacea]|nr:DMT family transporter [Massilia atriviolacea]